MYYTISDYYGSSFLFSTVFHNTNRGDQRRSPQSVEWVNGFAVKLQKVFYSSLNVLSIYSILSIYLSIYLSILSIYSIYLSIYLSIHLFRSFRRSFILHKMVYLSIYLFYLFYLFIDLSIHLIILFSLHRIYPIYPSIYFIHLLIDPDHLNHCT